LVLSDQIIPSTAFQMFGHYTYIAWIEVDPLDWTGGSVS
jgi:hypothetical protein